MKTISDVEFKNKTVLLRSDLNSDIINMQVIESKRIKPASETIRFLQKKGAKVVVIAHQGNPGKSDFVSLKEHSKLINRYVKIKFVSDTVGEKSRKEIKNLKPGQAILLENIRFEKDEFNPKNKQNKILKFFLPLIDIYVNDAFSVCHRKHTSIVSFPRYKPSCAGIVLEKEITALKKISIKNCLYILGGAKPGDNLKLLKNKNKILTGGIFGQMCIEAKGASFGENNEQVNKKMAKDYSLVLSKIKKLKNKNIITPIDYAVEVSGKRVELGLEKFPTKYVIYDIGEKTIRKYKEQIRRAKSVYMKGPVGFAGKKQFAKGTFEILKTIASQTSKGKLFSLIGGGHLSDAIARSKIPISRFSHISLSGGALLSYVAGEKLPGLEALGHQAK
ncbi:MAG: phosphoglycerate kinase [Nanoarchaeota archaeon]|nr:phosphoglycerate kinase [Nanoarchaeota archaeon]MBU4086206.1 phosphoglycerate kinase [Nanoarchaeota archaeon]